MKLTLIALMILATACDAPQRVRRSAGVENASTSPMTSAGSFDGGTNAGTNGTSSTAGGTTGTQTINCVGNVTAYHAGIGNVVVCQDSANETYFKLTYANADQTDGTCAVPMYRDTTGNSTYLGNAQCSKHNAGQVMYGNLPKNRTGYSQYPLNSVMFIKYSATNAFFQCMNAYTTTYQACLNAGGNTTYCNQSAQAYMTNICTNFRNTYPYAQVSTR